MEGFELNYSNKIMRYIISVCARRHLMARLRGELIELVPLKPDLNEHVQMFVNTRNNPRMHLEGEKFTKISLQEAQKEITQMRRRDSSVLVCAINVADNPIGWCTLDIVGKKDRTGILGYYVLPEFQGNGYATEAAALLTEIAFDKWNACIVQGSIRPNNKASQRVLKKLGFQLKNREEIASNDVEYIDMILSHKQGLAHNLRRRDY